MSLLDIENKITPTTLKKHKFSKSVWGAPDSWEESKSKNKYRRDRKAIWYENHMMWEKVTSDYDIFYFPDIFEGYVNINRSEIKNHAGWMLGSSIWDNATSGWVAYKIEDETDFEVALHSIIKQLKDKR